MYISTNYNNFLQCGFNVLEDSTQSFNPKKFAEIKRRKSFLSTTERKCVLRYTYGASEKKGTAQLSSFTIEALKGLLM